MARTQKHHQAVYFSAAFSALLLASLICLPSSTANAQSRYATSDSLTDYVHWIDLYDENNQRITPDENPRPYSPEKTCGRCHDFNAISHGWHFNAALPTASSDSGRAGQPLIWSDPRTGTFLPLSYRGWKGTFQPSDLGLTNWQVAAKVGGYMPGVPPDTPQRVSVNTAFGQGESASSEFSIDRSHLTGALPIDCMLCHYRPGSGYSPFTWTEQIADQNFAYAPTAALGIAVVTGGMRRLKDDFDLKSEETREQLPKVQYERGKFRSDGKVFIDLVRRPSNESCYYCHTSMDASEIRGDRWLHDSDVHLRAGLLCVDCHRNGLDHQTIRGFEGEVHPSEPNTAAFSCRGCHLDQSASDFLASSGRLGAPQPAHRGLPPIHFEKLSCTACHSGSLPTSEVGRQLLSIGHDLGLHIKRTGNELPAILGNLMLPLDASGQAVSAEGPDAGKYTPVRMMWPSYWAVLRDGKVRPLNPEQAYELVRRPLKVRRDFVEDLSEVKLSLSQRKEILGDERMARMKLDELSDEQRQKIGQAESTERKKQVDQRMLAALAAIESAIPDSKAVFVSGGAGFAKGSDDRLIELPAEELGEAAQPYAWPSSHVVRPARQSVGAGGCNDCHSDSSAFFNADLRPVGVLPDQSPKLVTVNQLQQVDTERLVAWNRLFEGRSAFKALGLLALGFTVALTLGACAVVSLRRNWLTGLCYIAFCAAIFVLAVTSYGSILRFGHMSNYALIGHTVWAGAFTFLLPIVGLAYLGRGRTGLNAAGDGSPGSTQRWPESLTAWLLMSAALVTAGSMFLSMLPVLDTGGLLQATQVHRYAGAATAALAIIHILSVVVGKLRRK